MVKGGPRGTGYMYTGKGQFSFQSQRKGNAKECLNDCTVAFSSHASNAVILQSRFQQYVNWELPDAQAKFRKGRGTRDQIANILWIIEKTREFQKNHLLLCDWLHRNLWLCWSQQTGKFLKRSGYQTTLLVSWEICMQVKKQPLELGMEQWTGSKLGKGYIKSLYYHPAYLTSMQSTSCKMPGWMNHKLESRLPGERSTTSDIWIIPLKWQKAKMK